MKQLLEAGVHFGHQTRRWNPKMATYIYTERNGIYIIDLQKTVKKLEEAYNFVKDLSGNGQALLFVGTKKQAQEAIKEEAGRCGMYYVNARWLGGMMTNFKTMRTRVDRLNQLKKWQEDGTFDKLPKKEVMKLMGEIFKLEKYLGGVVEMKKSYVMASASGSAAVSASFSACSSISACMLASHTSYRHSLKNCAACSSVKNPPCFSVMRVFTRPGMGGLLNTSSACFLSATYRSLALGARLFPAERIVDLPCHAIQRVVRPGADERLRLVERTRGQAVDIALPHAAEPRIGAPLRVPPTVIGMHQALRHLYDARPEARLSIVSCQ